MEEEKAREGLVRECFVCVCDVIDICKVTSATSSIRMEALMCCQVVCGRNLLGGNGYNITTREGVECFITMW